MHAALDVNLPNYASAIVNTAEVVEAISSVNTLSGGQAKSVEQPNNLRSRAGSEIGGHARGFVTGARFQRHKRPFRQPVSILIASLAVLVLRR